MNSDDSTPATVKVKKLSEMGLTPTEIASVIGKKPNYVTATLSNLKKSDKKDDKKKKVTQSI